MRKRKKTLALLLCLALVFTCIFPAGAVQPEEWVPEPEISPRALNPYELLGWLYPVFGFYYISNGYDPDAGHYAIDIAGTNSLGQGINGEYAKATADGKLVYCAYYGNHGNYMVIETGVQDPGGNPYEIKKGLRACYSHLQDLNGRSVNQQVTRGMNLARIGSTGKSTGPHLHFSIIRDGTLWAIYASCVNPQKFYPNIRFTGDVSDRMY